MHIQSLEIPVTQYNDEIHSELIYTALSLFDSTFVVSSAFHIWKCPRLEKEPWKFMSFTSLFHVPSNPKEEKNFMLLPTVTPVLHIIES